MVSIRPSFMSQPRRSVLAALLVYIAVVKAMPFLLSHFGLDITREGTAYLWGLTPVFALGLFGVARFRSIGLGMALPMCAWFAGDLLIGAAMGLDWMFYRGWYVTYVAFAVLCLGGLLLRDRRGLPRVMGVALGSSIAFFLVSNFAAWLWDMNGDYPRTLAGLLICYAAGVPFYKMQVISTLLFSGLLFSPVGEGFLMASEERLADEGATVTARS